MLRAPRAVYLPRHSGGGDEKQRAVLAVDPVRRLAPPGPGGTGGGVAVFWFDHTSGFDP